MPDQMPTDGSSLERRAQTDAEPTDGLTPEEVLDALAKHLQAARADGSLAPASAQMGSPKEPDTSDLERRLIMPRAGRLGVRHEVALGGEPISCSVWHATYATTIGEQEKLAEKIDEAYQDLIGMNGHRNGDAGSPKLPHQPSSESSDGSPN